MGAGLADAERSDGALCGGPGGQSYPGLMERSVHSACATWRSRRCRYKRAARLLLHGQRRENPNCGDNGDSALDDVCASVEEDLPRAIPENPGISDMLRQGDGQAGAHRMLAKYGTTETEWMTRQLQKSSESILPVGEYTAVLERWTLCRELGLRRLPHCRTAHDGLPTTSRAGLRPFIAGWPAYRCAGGGAPWPAGCDRRPPKGGCQG